jgi:hypothetical protein
MLRFITPTLLISWDNVTGAGSTTFSHNWFVLQDARSERLSINGNKFFISTLIGWWKLVIGYWLLVIGYWLLVIGHWMQI